MDDVATPTYRPMIAALETLGHRVTPWPGLIAAAGALCCKQADGPYGPRVGGAHPRRTAYAMGW